jgi:transposase InsO family protein
VNHKRVERVMREHGIVGVHLRKTVRTTVPEPSATPVPDLIRRDFTASGPNTKYVGDITYLPIGDGKFLYLAAVLDLHSKRLAGWSIAPHLRTELVTDALRPRPPPAVPPVSTARSFTATTAPNMSRWNLPPRVGSWG